MYFEMFMPQGTHTGDLTIAVAIIFYMTTRMEPRSSSQEEGEHMAKKKGEGFHSAAGLIRYFDSEEETAPSIPPKLVMATGIIIAAIVQYLHWQYPF